MEIEEGGCLGVEVELGIFLSLRDLLSWRKGGQDLFHSLYLGAKSLSNFRTRRDCSKLSNVSPGHAVNLN
jgi:hypothetical protein